MKKLIRTAAGAILVASALIRAAAAQAPVAEHVVVIDGLSPDGLRKAKRP
jgi:hypothetical protein